MAENIKQVEPALSTGQLILFDQQAAGQLPFHDAVACWERHLLQGALRNAQGNKSDAARQLGMNRRLLYDKMNRLGIE